MDNLSTLSDALHSVASRVTDTTVAPSGSAATHERACDLSNITDQPDNLTGPPRLPLELIELILQHAFVPSQPLTPHSDPFHLHSTTHLLLVSHAFHDLCLPFFYHTLVITRPSHLVRFFSPTGGIFTGPQGQKCWTYVKALGLVAGVRPPLVSNPPTQPGDPWIVPLFFPSSSWDSKHSLSRACIIDYRDPSLPPPPPPTPRSPISLDPDVAHLVSLARSHPFIQTQCASILRAEYEDDAEMDDALPTTEEGFLAWVDANYAESVEDVLAQMPEPHIELQIEHAREAALSELFQSARPKRLVLPGDPYTHESLLGANLDHAQLIELHLESGGTADLEVVLETVANMIYNIGGNEVRLVGYPEELLGELGEILVEAEGEEHESAEWRWTAVGEDGVVRVLWEGREEEGDDSGDDWRDEP